MKIKVNEYLLKNSKIKDKKNILVISDIHGDIKKIKAITTLIKDFSIDYILIPGDIVDCVNQKKQKEFVDELIKLSKYKKVYATIGNHDLFVYKREMIHKEEFNTFYFYTRLKNEKNFTLFINDLNSLKIDDNITINAINFDNDYYIEKENKELFDKFMNNIEKKYTSDNNFNILLCHTPNNLASKNKIITDNKIIDNANLILSGHNHGGLLITQIQDLLKNHYGLIGPYNKIIQKNSYGIINGKNKSLFISNGVTKMSESAPLKMIHNIGNKIFMPEIDLITLENGEEHSMKLIKRKVYKI